MHFYTSTFFEGEEIIHVFKIFTRFSVQCQAFGKFYMIRSKLFMNF